MHKPDFGPERGESPAPDSYLGHLSREAGEQADEGGGRAEESPGTTSTVKSDSQLCEHRDEEL